MRSLKYLLIFGMSVLFFSCKKDPEPEPEISAAVVTTGNLSLHFEHVVDTNALVLNTQLYTNANGDTFNITRFDYYISNIKLTKAGVVKYVEANSYHLIKSSDTTTFDIALANVPFDIYDGIEFMIGVDSARNVSGAQTGALAQSNGMFWSWSSGYIMLKMEGTSPQSTATGNLVEYHIGGFSGINNTLKTVSPSFNASTAIVSASISPEVHLSVNLNELFQSPTTINFATLSSVTMPGANAKLIADNYSDMFSVEHIHN